MSRVRPESEPARASGGASPDQWTTRSLIAWMTAAFTRAGLDSPRLMAEMLLSHALRCDRLRLYTDPDRPATREERDALRSLASRALKHEPVQHLVGEAWFFSIPLRADRRALVPRPSTETIVEHLLQRARTEPLPGMTDSKGAGALIADVCTGSGAIAIALLRNLPEARAVATDISREALSLAHENAQRAGVSGRLTLVEGDLLDALGGRAPERGFSAIVSNPPYIPDDEWPDVPPNVKDHEPEIALRGGPDGLALVRPLLRDGPAHLAPGAPLLVEVAASRADEALGIARENAMLADQSILRDCDGLPRVIAAVRR